MFWFLLITIRSRSIFEIASSLDIQYVVFRIAAAAPENLLQLQGVKASIGLTEAESSLPQNPAPKFDKHWMVTQFCHFISPSPTPPKGNLSVCK